MLERVGEAESHVEQVEGWAAVATETRCTCLEQQRALQVKLTDLGSRSRWNNIRNLGVAEGEERNSVQMFVDKLLQSELQLSQDLDLKIQQAHSLAQRSRPNEPLRPIIINFQEFITTEMILKEAWKKKKIQLGFRTLYFDHDFASEIVKKHREYNRMKKILKEKGRCFQKPYTNMQIHWDTNLHQCTGCVEGAEAIKVSGVGAGSI